MPTSTIERRKGSRHPQSWKAAGAHASAGWPQWTASEIKKAQRRRDLNKAGVVAALVVGHMLGDKDRCAAVLAAQRETLQHADQDKNDGREPAGCFECRQEADGCGGEAHDGEGHDECDSAADEVAETPKEECAKRTHEEADRERGQVGDESERIVARRIELGREDGRERAEDIEVVPLDHGACGRADDHFKQGIRTGQRRARCRMGCHRSTTSCRPAHQRKTGAAQAGIVGIQPPNVAGSAG